MCIAGGRGATVALPDSDTEAHQFLFGEDQARYCVATADAAKLIRQASEAGVAAQAIGTTGGDALTVDGLLTISVTDLQATHEGTLPDYMAAGTTAA